MGTTRPWARPHAHGDGSGHGHSHAHVARDAASARAIGIAALLTGGFMVVEVVGGLVSGSLALIADAGHMLTDFAALSMAWLAFRVARRPADAARTYGFDRLSVMAAFVNGLALFVVAAWIVVEAIGRLRTPAPIEGGVMMAVAAAGLAVNLLSFWVLSRGDRGNLNLRGALLHVLGDLLGSAGAIVAALVILLTGWTPMDPILSVLVSVLILSAGWRVVRESAHILLEGTPEGFDAAGDRRRPRPGAGGGGDPPPPRVVDQRGAADGDARGGGRGRRGCRRCARRDQGAAGGGLRLRPCHRGDPRGGDAAGGGGAGVAVRGGCA